MAYLRRRNRADDLSTKQRNTFLKSISLIFLGASASLFLANADLIINPQISNSIAYIKQFFVTSDGTSSGTVGVALDTSGVFSKLYCNLSGSLCKTTEDLFAVDAQLSGLVPRDDGQYTLFASGGKLFTGGLRTTVNGYSLATKLAIGFASPTNALDVLGSAYISGSAEIVGTLTVPMLSGIASINGVNIGEFATWNTLIANGFLTGSQIDAKLMTASNMLMAYITGTYLPLTGCATDQIPKFSGSLAKWVCSPDQVGVNSLTNYYTRGETDTNLASATGVLTTNLTNNYYTTGQIDTATGALKTYMTTNYYTTGQINTKGYITGEQVPSYETDPDFNSWINTDPLAGYVSASSLSTTLGGYVTTSVLSSALGNYVSTSSLSSTLGNYVSTSSLSSTLNNYVSTSSLSTSLAAYATTSSLSNYVTNTSLSSTLSSYLMDETDPDFNSWINSDPLASYATTSSLSNYVSNSSLSTTLGGYVSNSSLSTTLASYATTSSLSNYVSNSSLSTTLGGYVSNSSLSTTLGGYVTNSSLSSTLGNYATTASLSISAWNGASDFVTRANASDTLRIDNTNHRVGIGTNTPGAKLTILDGNFRIQNTSDIKAYDMGYDETNDYFYIDEFGVGKRFYIKNGGNVGIGTGDPGYPLTVVGTGLFTKSVFAEAFLYNSDKRLKTNIVEITDSLQKIAQLHGYTFDWQSDGRHDIGVIAQEVESVFPEAVVTKDNGFKTVNYPSLVAPIIQAIKALYTKYLDQQDQIDALKSQVATLETIVTQLK